MSLRGLLVLGACCLLLAQTARADVGLPELQIAARALSFMKPPLSGRVRVGIVYAPASPRSTREARQVRALLGRGLTVGGVTLEPVMVEVGDAAAANVDLFFSTESIGPKEKSLASISAARQIPCITTDMQQVQNGVCALGVQAAPRVRILVNRALAKRSGMTFATVFRVMITQI